MAEMIPDTIVDSSHASKAEKDVFMFLRDALVPDEEFRVWYEPRLGRKTPDFVIYSKSFGLLVLEVKGYFADKLINVTPKKFTVRKDGREESEDSPLAQAEKAYGDLMDRIKTRQELCHSEGPHKGKPLIPVGYCAAFPNIRQSAADLRGLTKVVTPTQCLFEEDFVGDPNDRSVQRRIMSKLRPIFAERVQFRFQGLDIRQEKALRTALSPEVQLCSTRSSDIAALDLAQERIAKSIGEGHRIVKGVVGSGKSIVVAARAKFLARCHPQWRVLVLCYNVPVTAPLREMAHAGLDAEATRRIDVLHYAGLVKKVAGQGIGRADESFEDWESRLARLLEEKVSSGNFSPYDAILIDEGQDFDEDMVRAVVKLLNPKTNSLLFCYDPAQNVFGRKPSSWKQLGIIVQGKRPTYLTQCYRSTSEIVSLASRFMGFESTVSDDFEAPLFPEASDRHGKLPRLSRLSDEQATIQFVLRGINYYVNEAGYSWNDIGVIYAKPGQDFALKFQRSFVAHFGVEATDKFYWINQDKREYDSQNAAVKLCRIESCKGLEFRIVFLVGIDCLPREGRSKDAEKKLVYVGLTRAQDELHIVAERDSLYLQQLQ